MLGLNQLGPTQYAAGKIYQSLLAYGPDLKPKPSLAKSWTISDDGLTYTFVLQDNVKWHDGKPFTSADVVFSTDKFLRETHPRLRALMNQRVASVAADGDDKVVFKLKEPFTPVHLRVRGRRPCRWFPKHVYEGTDYRTNPANNTPIGTGPFKFKEWKRGSYIHLVKNAEYFKPGLAVPRRDLPADHPRRGLARRRVRARHGRRAARRRRRELRGAPPAEAAQREHHHRGLGDVLAEPRGCR